jgi:hypothetical protein
MRTAPLPAPATMEQPGPTPEVCQQTCSTLDTSAHVWTPLGTCRHLQAPRGTLSLLEIPCMRSFNDCLVCMTLLVLRSFDPFAGANGHRRGAVPHLVPVTPLMPVAHVGCTRCQPTARRSRIDIFVGATMHMYGMCACRRTRSPRARARCPATPQHRSCGSVRTHPGRVRPRRLGYPCHPNT